MENDIDKGTEDRPPEGGGSSDKGHKQNGSSHIDTDGRNRDKLEMEGIKGASQAGHRSGKGKEDKPADIGIVAQEFHPFFVFTHEENGLAHGRMSKIPAENDCRADYNQGQIIKGGQTRHGDRGKTQMEIGSLDAEPIITTGNGMPFSRHGIKKGIKGQCQQGEISSFVSQEQTADNEAGDNGGHKTDQYGVP